MHAVPRLLVHRLLPTPGPPRHLATDVMLVSAPQCYHRFISLIIGGWQQQRVCGSVVLLTRSGRV